MHGAWVDRLVNNKSANLGELIDATVKLDESSRAVPAAGTVDLYSATYTRFKGLTQRLSTGGFL
jgi:hypothetical protein